MKRIHNCDILSVMSLKAPVGFCMGVAHYVAWLFKSLYRPGDLCFTLFVCRGTLLSPDLHFVIMPITRWHLFLGRLIVNESSYRLRLHIWLSSSVPANSNDYPQLTKYFDCTWPNKLYVCLRQSLVDHSNHGTSISLSPTPAKSNWTPQKESFAPQRINIPCTQTYIVHHTQQSQKR